MLNLLPAGSATSWSRGGTVNFPPRDCKPYGQKRSAGGVVLAGAPAKSTQNRPHHGAVYSPIHSPKSSATAFLTHHQPFLCCWCDRHVLDLPSRRLLISQPLFVMSIPPWSLSRSCHALLPHSSSFAEGCAHMSMLAALASSTFLEHACFPVLSLSLGSGPSSGMCAHLSILAHG
jgi:hypothetical protein